MKRRDVIVDCRIHGLRQPWGSDGAFYIYYSMFGFQRVGDLIWAAGDQRARGFLLGGTAGAPH